jgi:hypothetical protein
MGSSGIGQAEHLRLAVRQVGEIDRGCDGKTAASEPGARVMQTHPVVHYGQVRRRGLLSRRKEAGWHVNVASSPLSGGAMAEPTNLSRLKSA